MLLAFASEEPKCDRETDVGILRVVQWQRIEKSEGEWKENTEKRRRIQIELESKTEKNSERLMGAKTKHKQSGRERWIGREKYTKKEE